MKKHILPLLVVVTCFAGLGSARGQSVSQSASQVPSIGADWTIDSQSEWESNTESKSGVEFQDGMAVPSEPSATFRSKIKVFDQRQTPSRSQLPWICRNCPAWYGFQIELKTTDTTENASNVEARVGF